MNRPLINPLIRPRCKAPDFHPWIKFSSTVYVGKIFKKMHTSERWWVCSWGLVAIQHSNLQTVKVSKIGPTVKTLTLSWYKCANVNAWQTDKEKIILVYETLIRSLTSLITPLYVENSCSYLKKMLYSLRNFTSLKLFTFYISWLLQPYLRKLCSWKTSLLSDRIMALTL